MTRQTTNIAVVAGLIAIAGAGAMMRRPGAGARSGPVEREDHHGRRSLHHRAGGGDPRRPHRRRRYQPGDHPSGGAEHQTNRPRWKGGDAGADRQPYASAPRREHLGARAPLRRRRVAEARDRDGARPGEDGGRGRMGLQYRRLDPSSVRRRWQTVHARRTGSDRARQPGRAAGVVLPGFSEQPRPRGLRDQGEHPRPRRFRQGVDHARCGR